MLLSLLAASVETSRAEPVIGWAALSTIAIVPTVVWGLVSGTVAAWFGHRYAEGTDDEGYEVAVLADATCPRCDHVITLAEAAPGRSLMCTSCRRRLPFSWLATQLAVMAGCIAMLYTFGPNLVLVPFLWLIPVIVTASVTDLRTILIPKRLVHIGLGVGFASIAGVALWRGAPDTLKWAAIGSAAYFGVLAVANFVSPKAMGWGDVRLALVLGLYLGWIDWRLPLFGYFIANVVYLVYAGPGRILKWHRAYPFGPALATGTVLAIVFYTSLVPT